MSFNSGKNNAKDESNQNLQANGEGNKTENGLITNGSAAKDGGPDKSKLPATVGKNTSPGKDSDSSSDASFEKLSTEEATRENTLYEVVKKMSTKHHNIGVDQEELIFGKCKLLFEKDYVCKVMNNYNYSMNYPIGIIIPVGKKSDMEGLLMDFDVAQYAKLVEGAPEARLRSRFVAPAFLFDNKLICRSGALTVRVSALYESVIKPAPPRTVYDEDDNYIFKKVLSVVHTLGSITYRAFLSAIDWNVMTNLFETDVEILKHLKVERVCDLMVEYSKLYKKTFGVSSTEKAHEGIYGEVKMEEMPFPGCEFFTSYFRADRNAKDLFFNWNEDDVTRGLKLTEDLKSLFPELNVDGHKSWDLIQLTQNYLKMMLSFLVTGTGGIVIHCISGWDRTPLFVSLLRLSLWADGVVHENLGTEDMTYLTIAYDWFLFGHNLPDRFEKNEEIMHFSFNFLECITSDEFSVTRLFQLLPEEQKKNRVFPDFVPGRRVVLKKIRSLVLDLYAEEVMKEKA